MKIGFKNILIIFLVALLGAGIGTFGVMSIYTNNRPISPNLQISEVTYEKKEKTDYTSAIEKAYDSVVEIHSTVVSNTPTIDFFFYYSGPSTSTMSGSGVIISEDGYIVTNNHVIEGTTGQDDIEVKLYDGQTYFARVIGADARTDLALLKIEANNLNYVNIVDSSSLQMGEEVVAIGNPLGEGISCSNGIVSALEKEIYINNVYLTVIQTNAEINGGNSGGGLFDLEGNLVGIVNAKSSNQYSSTTIEGMGYAIPSNTVIRIISELKENGYVKDRPALGIRVYSNSSYYSVEGVVVSDVVEGGSAYKAGIKPNDVITQIDETKVTDYADLSKFLDSKVVGDIVTITILRDNQTLTFNVTLQSSTAN